MTFKTLLKACGASALVGAAALGAFPAGAQEEGRGHWRHADSTEQTQERQEARAERQAARAQAAPQQRVYQAPPAQEQARGSWNRGDNRSATGAERSGRDWNRRDNANNDWGQARAAQAQVDAQARQEAQSQAAERSRQWQRNRTYSDAARSGTYGGGTYGSRTYGSGYRDGYRADQRQDRRQQQNAYSSGYRDGQVTQHYRDGSRYDGYRGDYRRWSNDWRRDNRYNWYGYRNANRGLFSLGTYYSPYRNYRYSRLSIGFYLDSLFYGNRYWINDPWQYRLPAAYGPYRWIRYYDDALLVNIYTGQVEDVIYDFFW